MMAPRILCVSIPVSRDFCSIQVANSTSVEADYTALAQPQCSICPGQLICSSGRDPRQHRVPFNTRGRKYSIIHYGRLMKGGPIRNEKNGFIRILCIKYKAITLWSSLLTINFNPSTVWNRARYIIPFKGCIFIIFLFVFQNGDVKRDN
jgi:hypothetical protein